MRRFVLIFLTVLSVSAFAADIAVKGYLVDSACATRFARKGGLKPGAGSNHSLSCLRTEVCEQSGYGVITEDNRFIKFDQDGNAKAKKFIAEITKTSEIKVTVSGSVDGDKMTVGKIELQ
jgi:hypothetical protein